MSKNLRLLAGAKNLGSQTTRLVLVLVVRMDGIIIVEDLPNADMVSPSA